MKSRRIFIGGVIVFFVLLAIASYDISRRTTFPGSKPQLQERINKQFLEEDSVRKSRKDSAAGNIF